MSGKTLKRDVYLDGFMVPAGTELTAAQADRITNPKAFKDAEDATGPDANDARPYQEALAAASAKALAERTGSDKGDDEDTDDRAAAGAKLARGGRASAPAAKPEQGSTRDEARHSRGCRAISRSVCELGHSEGLQPVAVGAQRPEVSWLAVSPVAIPMIHVKLSWVFRHEPAAVAGRRLRLPVLLAALVPVSRLRGPSGSR